MQILENKTISFQEFTDFMLSGKILDEDVIRDLTVSHCEIYDVPEGHTIFVNKLYRCIKHFLGFFPYISTQRGNFFNDFLLSNVFLTCNTFIVEGFEEEK